MWQVVREVSLRWESRKEAVAAVVVRMQGGWAQAGEVMKHSRAFSSMTDRMRAQSGLQREGPEGRDKLPDFQLRAPGSAVC